MPAIKFHIYRTDMGDDGTQNCDYRGFGEDGADTPHAKDQHRTIPELEIDPASLELIEIVKENGPAANKLFAAAASQQPDWLDSAASILGLEGDGPIGLRVGIWDK